jgi:hypothetical protein
LVGSQLRPGGQEGEVRFAHTGIPSLSGDGVVERPWVMTSNSCTGARRVSLRPVTNTKGLLANRQALSSELVHARRECRALKDSVFGIAAPSEHLA